MEGQLSERKKLSRLEERCQHLTNRSASSLLSDLDDPTKGIQSIISQAAAVSSSRPIQSFVPAQRPVPQQSSQPVQRLEAAPSHPQIMYLSSVFPKLRNSSPLVRRI